MINISPQEPSPQEVGRNNDVPHSDLADIIELFEECTDRSFQQVPDAGKYPEPDPEKDIDIKLPKFRAACHEMDVEELLPSTLKNQVINWIRNADQKTLVGRYSSGDRVCFALIPNIIEGIPAVQFRQFNVSAKGMTQNLYSTPSYHFKLLPEEIQKHCTVRVPFYDHMLYPTPEERDELIARVDAAFDNLKEYLDKK